MSEPADIRRKRLKMRAGHRGIKEMDIILTAWTDARLATASPGTLDVFEDLLEENDQDLYQWVSDQEPAPAQFRDLIGDLKKIMDRRNNFA